MICCRSYCSASNTPFHCTILFPYGTLNPLTQFPHKLHRPQQWTGYLHTNHSLLRVIGHGCLLAQTHVTLYRGGRWWWRFVIIGTLHISFEYLQKNKQTRNLFTNKVNICNVICRKIFLIKEAVYLNLATKHFLTHIPC